MSRFGRVLREFCHGVSVPLPEHDSENLLDVRLERLVGGYSMNDLKQQLSKLLNVVFGYELRFPFLSV